MDDPNKKNFDYFFKNEDSFKKLYPNRILLIADCEIKEICNSIEEAYVKAIQKKYQQGEFICQAVDYDKPENMARFLNF